MDDAKLLSSAYALCKVNAATLFAGIQSIAAGGRATPESLELARDVLGETAEETVAAYDENDHINDLTNICAMLEDGGDVLTYCRWRLECLKKED
jgi:hypothetical protein